MKKLYGIFSILLCFFLAGCDDDSNEGGPALSIVKSDINFTAAGGNGTIEMAAEGTITATSDKD